MYDKRSIRTVAGFPFASARSSRRRRRFSINRVVITALLWVSYRPRGSSSSADCNTRASTSAGVTTFPRGRFLVET